MTLAEDKRAAHGQAVGRRRREIRTSSWSSENRARVTRVEHALRPYFNAGQRPALAVRHMLSDLRHYCDAYGIKYLERDEIASRNYMGQVLELI